MNFLKNFLKGLGYTLFYIVAMLVIVGFVMWSSMELAEILIYKYSILKSINAVWTVLSIVLIEFSIVIGLFYAWEENR